MMKAHASRIETRAAILAGEWGCDIGHAIRGERFPMDAVPTLPLPGCPYAPHCSCVYNVCLHDEPGVGVGTARSAGEQDAELEATLDALPTPVAEGVIRQLNAALAVFGLPARKRRP